MSLNLKYKKIIKILKHDGIGIMPTDTIYGLVGSALSKKAVEKVYDVKNRNAKKALIILISSINDLKKFDIKINAMQRKILEKYWPGKVSIILPCKSRRFYYIHRDTNSIAFRFPKKKSLVEILKKTGPLVAPSANPENLKPAINIVEAKKYFKDTVDFYISGGTIKGESSTILWLSEENKIEVLRGIIK